MGRPPSDLIWINNCAQNGAARVYRFQHSGPSTDLDAQASSDLRESAIGTKQVFLSR
jgi:hypothetical protein